MGQPLVHIGYHKTASSLLQERVFTGAHGFAAYDLHRVPDLFVIWDALDFDPARCRSGLDAWLGEAERDGMVPVFSHERLSGYPASGGFDSKEIADRIHGVLPEARILIVIREQQGMMFSTYRQYIVDGGAASIRGFLSPVVTGQRRVPLFSLRYFMYDRLIGHYHERFGSGQVLVLPHELLRRSPEEFLGRIASFSGVASRDSWGEVARQPVNVGMSGLGVVATRRFNQLFKANPLNPSPLFPSRVVSKVAGQTAIKTMDRLVPGPLRRVFLNGIRKAIARHADGAFAESNRRTSELIGLDLTEFGYE